MENWEKFEEQCTNYLNQNYGEQYNCKFTRKGGHDSKIPDIIVYRNSNQLFSIESKMPTAQCGQFVLFTDEENEKFIFSKANKCPHAKEVKDIISFLNHNFKKYHNPSNKNLDIDENLILNWVKSYYIDVKDSKFFITKGSNDFIIIPISEIGNYFSFSAKYRYKASGSTNPSSSDIEDLKLLLNEENIKYSSISKDSNKKVYANLECSEEKFIINNNLNKFQFKLVSKSNYRITKLSKTKNANFIVSIELKKPDQTPSDLTIFIDCLKE